MESFLFYAFALLSIMGGVGLVYFKHPLNGALSLIVTMLSLAGFYALLQAKIVFLMQIIVYAGAIMVLMVFVIMYLNVNDSDLLEEKNKGRIVALSTILMLPIIYLVFKALFIYEADPAILQDGFGTINSVGNLIFTSWMLPFELISMLLLVAVVGAVIIAHTRRDNVSC